MTHSQQLQDRGFGITFYSGYINIYKYPCTPSRANNIEFIIMISFKCMTAELLMLLVVLLLSTTVDAFTVTPTTTYIADAPLQTLATTNAAATPLVQYHQPLHDGITSYIDESNLLSTRIDSSSSSSTSMMLSLQERKIPTQEEIDQKKLTFNVIFWGGGFVAPFIATVFYFGFKFWEK